MSPVSKGTKLTNNPKNVRLEIRLTKAQSDLLEECSKQMETTKTGAIIKGIELVKEELDKK